MILAKRDNNIVIVFSFSYYKIMLLCSVRCRRFAFIKSVVFVLSSLLRLGDRLMSERIYRYMVLCVLYSRGVYRKKKKPNLAE